MTHRETARIFAVVGEDQDLTDAIETLKNRLILQGCGNIRVDVTTYSNGHREVEVLGDRDG